MITMPRQRRRQSVVSIFFVVLAGLFFSGTSFSATFNVSNTSQLRQALENAAVNGQDDTIILEAGVYKTADDGLGTFKFSDTEAHNLTIKAKDGLTSSDVILDGNNTHQVLNFTVTQNSTFIIYGISVVNGYTGGGIYINKNLTVINCVMSNNDGGGIYIENENSIIDIMTEDLAKVIK